VRASSSPATRCGRAACRSSPSTRALGADGLPGHGRGRSKVNGVAELHSQLLRDKVLPDFSAFCTPEKFTNVTNGVTPRRFIRLANPKLSR
jgi:hypothetical protein